MLNRRDTSLLIEIAFCHLLLSWNPQLRASRQHHWYLQAVAWHTWAFYCVRLDLTGSFPAVVWLSLTWRWKCTEIPPEVSVLSFQASCHGLCDLGAALHRHCISPSPFPRDTVEGECPTVTSAILQSLLALEGRWTWPFAHSRIKAGW